MIQVLFHFVNIYLSVYNYTLHIFIDLLLTYSPADIKSDPELTCIVNS